MKITEIAGKYTKESTNSITVVDECGKTKGVVRNVQWYRNLPLRDEMEWKSKWKQSGFTPERGDLRNFALVDGEWYVIVSNRNSRLEEIKARYEGKFNVIVCDVLRPHFGQW